MTSTWVARYLPSTKVTDHITRWPRWCKRYQVIIKASRYLARYEAGEVVSYQVSLVWTEALRVPGREGSMCCKWHSWDHWCRDLHKLVRAAVPCAALLLISSTIKPLDVNIWPSILPFFFSFGSRHGCYTRLLSFTKSFRFHFPQSCDCESFSFSSLFPNCCV